MRRLSETMWSSSVVTSRWHPHVGAPHYNVVAPSLGVVFSCNVMDRNCDGGHSPLVISAPMLKIIV